MLVLGQSSSFEWRRCPGGLRDAGNLYARMQSILLQGQINTKAHWMDEARNGELIGKHVEVTESGVLAWARN